MKEKWIKIIRTQRREIDWMPAKNSTICSEHFNEGDIYETKKKLRRLKKTAVPIIEEIKYEEDESSDVIEQNEQCSLQKKNEQEVAMNGEHFVCKRLIKLKNSKICKLQKENSRLKKKCSDLKSIVNIFWRLHAFANVSTSHKLQMLRRIR
ncbi:uncharacterized protein LOC123694761 isoform X1 [Colias croceus]|uniref:uncharacterized protein LOC123694761 isoform X1 n=1 Tax=Colias crocea TaxID=72248 RepID=UPI001E27D55A|nr:uncharacterized protein LOC123694761 isoform X1 [Colias croceus]